MDNPYIDPYNGDHPPGYPQPVPSLSSSHEQGHYTGFDLTRFPPLLTQAQPTVPKAPLSQAQIAQAVISEASSNWQTEKHDGRMEDRQRLEILMSRCQTTRQGYADAITGFEMHNQIFLSTHSPMSRQERDEYLRSYYCALTAARGLFGPQEIYRDALARMTQFTTELIDSMPHKLMVDRRSLKTEFGKSTHAVKEKEEKVREAMRNLHGKTGYTEINKMISLKKYIENMKKRVENWQEEEVMVYKYAKTCLDLMM